MPRRFLKTFLPRSLTLCSQSSTSRCLNWIFLCLNCVEVGWWFCKSKWVFFRESERRRFFNRKLPQKIYRHQIMRGKLSSKFILLWHWNFFFTNYRMINWFLNNYYSLLKSINTLRFDRNNIFLSIKLSIVLLRISHFASKKRRKTHIRLCLEQAWR